MTATPHRVVGYIISVAYVFMRSCTYLLTYTVGSGRIKPAICPKRLKIERSLYKVVHYTGFRLPPICMTLNDLWARMKVIHSLNAARMTKYSLVMTPTPCRVAGDIISTRPTDSCARALTYLLKLTQNNQPVFLATGLWASSLTFQRMICLPFHCLW